MQRLPVRGPGFAVITLVALAAMLEAMFRAFPNVSPEHWALERLSRLSPAGNPSMQEIRRQAMMTSAAFLPDPYLGATIAPAQHRRVETLDYTYLQETDSLGFPNHDPWPGQADIVLLGNSLATGPGVGIEGQYSTLVGRRLGRSVINLGVPGSGTEVQYRLFGKYGAPLHPKVVVETIWPVWEVDNSVKFARWLRQRSAKSFTDYRLGFGRARPGHARTGARDLLWRSALVRATYLCGKALLSRPHFPDSVMFPDGTKMYLSLREQLRLAQGLHRRGIPDVGKLFVEPLERLRRQVQADGGRLLIVLTPSREEIYSAKATPEVLNTLRALKPLLEAAKLPLLDAYPAFAEHAMEEPLFFARDMHLSRAGNELLASLIAERLELDGLTGTNIALGRSTAAPP